jgi:hypothetical protein
VGGPPLNANGRPSRNSVVACRVFDCDASMGAGGDRGSDQAAVGGRSAAVDVGFKSPLGHKNPASLRLLTYWWSSALDHAIGSSMAPEVHAEACRGWSS